MKKLRGVYLTDGLSQSGVCFTIPYLEEALWRGYNECVPSNVSHDIHRPLGVTRVSSLFFSHESTYLLGLSYIPETEKEMKMVMEARTKYLNEKMMARVFQYSREFYDELQACGLLNDGGRFMSNGVVMYGYNNIALAAFPELKNITDDDGLVLLFDLFNYFDYKGDGVFASRKNKLAVMVHPYLRRSLSRYNCFNKVFLQELFDCNKDDSPVRIRIDLDYIGFAPSFIETHEFDFWFGPSYSDDISEIREGVTTFNTKDNEYAYNQIKKTEFVWQNKKGKRQFEMEEVTDVDAPTLAEGTYGCRYIHSMYDRDADCFDHFDGAIRSYNLELICERLENSIDAMGHRADYTKLFRIDGKLALNKWKSLITHYLKGNQDVYRYFGVEVPYVEEKQEMINPLSRYVPFILKQGDGIRILYSYHPQKTVDVQRYFTDFDVCRLSEGTVETADMLVVDLTKCIRRVGGNIEYPTCLFTSYRDNFHDLPEIYHGSEHPEDDMAVTIAGVKLLLEGLKNKGNNDCISFCLSWDMGDRKAKLSIIGSIPDMVQWLKTITKIPADRVEMVKWLKVQSDFIKKNGVDTPSPVYMTFIHPNGIFYHRRRLIQEDTELKDIFVDDDKGLCASIDFPKRDQELADLLNNGLVGPTSFVVGEKLIDENETDYLLSDKIATLSETSYHLTIHFMTLVWASDENALTGLLHNCASA